MDNKKVIVATIVGTSSIVLLSDLQSGKGIPAPQTWIALGALYFMLGLTVDFVPTIAVPLALIIFAAVLFSRGEPLLNGLIRATKKRKFTVINGGRNKNVR